MAAGMPAPPVAPVYVTARALPDYESLPTVYDVCVAAEAVCGRETIRGAQRVRGLWWIYPKTNETRDKLLLEGFLLRGARVSLLDKNPFVIRDQTDEKPTTKLWINNVPLSIDNKDIEAALQKLGVEIRSSLRNELARNPDGRLTRFETGRRFVFISVPSTPLRPVLRLGVFTAALYHKEQKQKLIKCSKCLQDGHLAANCEGEVVCRGCLQQGHKMCDCPSVVPPAPEEEGAAAEQSEETNEHKEVGEEMPSAQSSTTPTHRVQPPARASDAAKKTSHAKPAHGTASSAGKKRERSESPPTTSLLPENKRPAVLTQPEHNGEAEAESMSEEGGNT
ncbi:uncharacterized protein LOC143286631 [Babylonia areolata]|uniref:uncharacterized protein LOC143286631 n=1 Tax=Babylonia areolata TaxID=304850 RepID=UPI003FD0EE3C